MVLSLLWVAHKRTGEALHGFPFFSSRINHFLSWQKFCLFRNFFSALFSSFQFSFFFCFSAFPTLRGFMRRRWFCRNLKRKSFLLQPTLMGVEEAKQFKSRGFCDGSPMEDSVSQQQYYFKKLVSVLSSGYKTSLNSKSLFMLSNLVSILRQHLCFFPSCLNFTQTRQSK